MNITAYRGCLNISQGLMLHTDEIPDVVIGRGKGWGVRVVLLDYVKSTIVRPCVACLQMGMLSIRSIVVCCMCHIKNLNKKIV